MTDKASTPIEFGDWPGRIVFGRGGVSKPYAVRYAPGGAMEKPPLPKRTVPDVAVPTTAGSASDVMPTAAARDPHSRVKLLFWDDDLTPSATVLDPEMAVYTPAALTAATGMTAMAARSRRFTRPIGIRSLRAWRFTRSDCNGRRCPVRSRCRPISTRARRV